MSEKKSLILLFLLAALFMLLGHLLNIATGSSWAGYGLTVLIIIFCLFFVGYRRRHYVLAQNAHTAYLKKQYDVTYNLYEKAIAMPKCPEEIKVVYAYKLIAQGHLERAQKVVETINEDILNTEGKFNLKVVQGLILYKEDKLDEAIAIYEALTKESDAEQLWETYGMILNLSEKYELARDYSLAALEKYPNNKLIKENLATSYFYLFEDKKARKLYRDLINQDVAYPDPYYYYARIAYLDDRYNLALKYIEIAEVKSPAPLSNITMDVIFELKDEIIDNLDRIEFEADSAESSYLESSPNSNATDFANVNLLDSLDSSSDLPDSDLTNSDVVQEIMDVENNSNTTNSIDYPSNISEIEANDIYSNITPATEILQNILTVPSDVDSEQMSSVISQMMPIEVVQHGPVMFEVPPIVTADHNIESMDQSQVDHNSANNNSVED